MSRLVCLVFVAANSLVSSSNDRVEELQANQNVLICFIRKQLTAMISFIVLKMCCYLDGNPHKLE